MEKIRGFVDQIFEESKIMIIISKDNHVHSVSFDNIKDDIKCGDFVIFDGINWYKDPKNLTLKKEFKNLIESVIKKGNS